MRCFRTQKVVGRVFALHAVQASWGSTRVQSPAPQMVSWALPGVKSEHRARNNPLSTTRYESPSPNKSQWDFRFYLSTKKTHMDGLTSILAVTTLSISQQSSGELASEGYVLWWEGTRSDTAESLNSQSFSARYFIGKRCFVLFCFKDVLLQIPN